MPRLAPFALSLALVSILAACQMGAGGDGVTGDLTANAVAGDPIEVTALDAPEVAEDQPAGPRSEGEKPAQSSAPIAGADVDGVAEIEPAPQPELEEPPPEEQKSDKQIACEKKGGQWSKVGSLSRICIFTTRDSGKSCTMGSQCEGDCLARSGTCAPIRPLLGCNEILQDDGSRATICIE